MKPSYEMVRTPSEQSWLVRDFDQPEVVFDWHVHDEVELVLMHEGHGQCFAGDSIRVFGANEFVLFGSQFPHTFKSDPGVKRILQSVIQFKPNFLGREIFEHPEFYGIKRMLHTSGSGIRFGEDLAQELRPRIVHLSQLKPAYRTVELLHILTRLSEVGGERISQSPLFPASSSKTKSRLQSVVAFINGHIAEEVTLEQVASIAEMSPTAFSRFFHQQMGSTLTDYINDIRITAAKGRLRELDIPIAEIARQVGYNNTSNFNRQFKLRSDMRPRDYRMQFQKQ